MENKSGYFLGIKFLGSEKSYFFSCPTNDFALGDLVIVMTSAGVEAGKVTSLPAPLSTYTSNLELKAILRKADERDIQDYERNLEDAKKALQITRKAIENLGLAMDLIDAFYTIDGTRITITYTSTEKRVDFRELLKVLAPQLGCRIELRQIASRDKAKMIGGLGLCGLPLCCATFLNQFEGISIQRAKNQMLTLNIPKLSGHCGKLICCLTYEDDAYTEAKKEFPRMGTAVKTDEGLYTVDAINILSRTVRLVNATRSDYKTFTLEDVQAMLNGTYKPKVELIRAEDAPLPSFGIEKPRNKEENPANSNRKNEKKPDRNNQNHEKNRRDERRGGDNRQGKNSQQDTNKKGGRNHDRSQRNPQQQNPANKPEGDESQSKRRHFHRHRHRGGRGGNHNEGGGNE